MIRSSLKDLIRLFKNLKIDKGDTLLVHSNIATLGLIKNGQESILKALMEVIGPNGNLVVPTFTFSFCKKEVFDIKDTRSKVGIFTDFLRQVPGAIRSSHGITSFASLGNDSTELMKLNDKSSYGNGSVPGNLIKANCKILQLGVPNISHTHYIEQMIGVPYRFEKKFKGKIREGNKSYTDEHSLYVRRNDKQVNKLVGKDPRKYFFEKEQCNIEKYAYGLHRSFYIIDYINYLKPILEKDKFSLIDKDAYNS